ncbi:MAG: YggT family protein [Solirubrobacterales bacterium]|jgi:YggT family protein|nr:YggT family protein [Solirubrobacterales bacterium]MDX6652835.1 YggT family protein [Solirubrobacterales bacterium]MDX6663680.1 YggT family protein [Solirubrobacterales bacterium]
MTALLAIGNRDVADYVSALFLVYFILIFARILVSWIPRMPYNRSVGAVTRFLAEVTDPYLNLFRRIIPPIGGAGMAIDVSPMIAIILLMIVRSLVVGAIIN